MVRARAGQRGGTSGGRAGRRSGRPTGAGFRTVTFVAVVGLMATGCTICPDPFDYSGPVPNGSAPQNDFRARSNGILPVGAAPRPWPLIVRESPDPAADPPVAPAVPAPGDGAAEVALRQVAGVEEASPHDPQPAASISEADTPPDALESAAPPALEPAPDQTMSRPLPRQSVAGAHSAGAERVGETPGWRPRRR